MSTVVGIDPSLTSTGVATFYDDGHIILHTVVTKGARDETLPERAARIEAIGEHVGIYLADAEFGGIALIVIEGPAGATPGGSTWDRAGLWWLLVRAALRRAPVATVIPTTRAKWATTDGRADKAAVAAAMTRRLHAGTVLAAPSVTINNSDEADALALAWMGAQHLDWQPATAAERTSLKVVRWPDLISD